MIRITSVELNRFNAEVCFDDGSRLRLRKKDVEAQKLRVGEELDYQALYGRLCASQFPEGYEAALDILDRSAKTEQEIKKKLLLKGYLPEAAQAVCDKLREAKLLDDKYIAERIVSAMSAAGKGKYAMAVKLRARGIGREESLDLLEGLDEESQKEATLSSARKLQAKYVSDDPRRDRQKLSQALIRRGFSWDDVQYALERIGLDDEV